MYSLTTSPQLTLGYCIQVSGTLEWVCAHLCTYYSMSLFTPPTSMQKCSKGLQDLARGDLYCYVLIKISEYTLGG